MFMQGSWLGARHVFLSNIDLQSDGVLVKHAAERARAGHLEHAAPTPALPHTCSEGEWLPRSGLGRGSHSRLERW